MRANPPSLVFFAILCLLPVSAIASPKLSYQHLIQTAAIKHAVDPALIQAVIQQESGYNRFAISPAGAQGLMQLMPDTAKRFQVKNAFAPAQNINAGSQYLAWLLKRFNGNVRFALAGYNAGEGKVDRYKGVPPYRETRRYVKKVMGYYQQLKAQSSTQHTTSVQPLKSRSNSVHLVKKHPYQGVIHQINHPLSQLKIHRVQAISLFPYKTAPEHYTHIRASHRRGI